MPSRVVQLFRIRNRADGTGARPLFVFGHRIITRIRLATHIIIMIMVRMMVMVTVMVMVGNH